MRAPERTSDPSIGISDLPVVERLRRDLKDAARALSPEEARFLVDYYYLSQEDRKRAHNQVRALDDNDEPSVMLQWLADQAETVESQIKRALAAYTDAHPLGQWAKSNVGIGPVIAAGLLAHIDLERTPTVGHIWSYAGLDPTSEWKSGEKRPWNASLKTLCWKIGQSFMKFSGHEDCQYGHLYRERKAKEIANNEAGKFADQAAAILAKKKIGKDTEAYAHYSAGRLPPAHIDARARRWAVKLFLSHYHAAGYQLELKRKPPLPYPIAILKHVHMIEPSQPIVPSPKSEPSKVRAPKSKSEPLFRRAPKNESEPLSRRSPSKGSEPRGIRAPRQTSEPKEARAPQPRSQPLSSRAPKRRSEPKSKRAPISASEPKMRRAPRQPSESSATRAPEQASGRKRAK